jgi:hypothetical protein
MYSSSSEEENEEKPSLSMFLTGASAVFAQTAQSGQGAKEDVKEAGRATGRATK